MQDNYKYFITGSYILIIMNDQKYTIHNNDPRYFAIKSNIDKSEFVINLIRSGDYQVNKYYKINYNENCAYYYKNKIPMEFHPFFYNQKTGIVNEDKIKMYLDLKGKDSINIIKMLENFDHVRSISNKKTLFVSEKEGNYTGTPIFYYKKDSYTFVLYKMLLVSNMESLIDNYFKDESKSLKSNLIDFVCTNNRLNLSYLRYNHIIKLIPSFDDKMKLIQSIDKLPKMNKDQLVLVGRILEKMANFSVDSIVKLIGMNFTFVNDDFLNQEFNNVEDFIFKYEYWVIQTRIKKEDIEYYKQSQYEKFLNPIKVTNNISIQFPKTNIDLELYSLLMRNCIRGYFSKISNKCILFAVYINNELEYNVEVNLETRKIIQFERKYKTKPDPLIKQLITEKFINPELFCA